ncbi:hypothetical protein LX36DRAFT_18157 [Colletotrichum falcatum]|nr:hypothetical protein LX36DRAFT_18157 [Colletotrichum falcatum]
MHVLSLSSGIRYLHPQTSSLRTVDSCAGNQACNVSRFSMLHHTCTLARSSSSLHCRCSLLVAFVQRHEYLSVNGRNGPPPPPSLDRRTKQLPLPNTRLDYDRPFTLPCLLCKLLVRAWGLRCIRSSDHGGSDCSAPAWLLSYEQEPPFQAKEPVTACPASSNDTQQSAMHPWGRDTTSGTVTATSPKAKT